MEHPYLCRSSVRGNLEWSSITGDSGGFQRRFWKRIIPIMGHNKWNLRFLGREGSASMFIVPKPVLDIFLKCRGCVALFLATKPKKYFSLWSGLLDRNVVRKTSPRWILAFIKAVCLGNFPFLDRKGQRIIRRHSGPVHTMVYLFWALRTRTNNTFHSTFYSWKI
jgi:hypothetical protein